MLSNAYFVAKIRFDTAENEPGKNLQICRYTGIPVRASQIPGNPDLKAALERPPVRVGVGLEDLVQHRELLQVVHPLRLVNVAGPVGVHDLGSI